MSELVFIYKPTTEKTLFLDVEYWQYGVPIEGRVGWMNTPTTVKSYMRIEKAMDHLKPEWYVKEEDAFFKLGTIESHLIEKEFQNANSGNG